MDRLAETVNRETLRVRFEEGILFAQIHRPHANNTINGKLVAEFAETIGAYRDRLRVLVIEGLPEVFCFGADFQEMSESPDPSDAERSHDPGALYDLWQDIAHGGFISIAHVRGKANAGGVGFVAACDIVLCEEKSVFSLSELLFGLMPACVLPFLIRKIGFAKANYMTLMTNPVTAREAMEWGLADACAESTDLLLRKHLSRLRRLDKEAIVRYKRYMGLLSDFTRQAREPALQANLEVFLDGRNRESIARYVATGQFPWEKA
jgi:polyketide biosynthesis enoyl-CoA hydratase PksH